MIYSYDQGSRLTAILTTKSATTIDSVGYSYDNVGNRIAKTQQTVNYNYTYDAIYRLTQATPSSGNPETYTYDQVGNRLTKVPDTPPTINETTQYSYDDENRLTGVQITANNKTKQLSFTYDPFGRRISKTLVKDEIGTDCTSPNVCPRTTNYVYDKESIIMEYDQIGTITAKYIHGSGIDEPLAVTQGTNTYFYHADGLGSITALTNTSGAVVQTYSYDSFGNMTQTGNISQPFTYTAREYDTESGMYFYRARYYDSKAGRFLTRDPIGFKGGINQYAYVKNNPVKYRDPLGLYLCFYSIGSHQMNCVSNYSNPDFESNNFVSGNNNSSNCTDCQDNPDKTNVKYHGPIPPGTYDIGKLHDRHRRDLTPDPPNGRDRFQIHGCGDDPNSCSKGCIGSTNPAEVKLFNSLMSLEEGANWLIVYH